MKKLVIGILAHVDAGKTTLSESMLYLSGSIRKLGRVDYGNAFLDTYELERERGITIFSKQAVFTLGETQVTLLDTPGHVDFSAEMERTLQVLDYAILVINGADGVQGHTQTLWRLLARYQIPVVLFVNKMDQNGTDKEALMAELKKRLDEGCTDFGTEQNRDDFMENLAMCDETSLERYLETGLLETEDIIRLIMARKVFPCFFGSALKLTGVEEFLKGIETYMKPKVFPEEFGAKVYKIARDDQGSRLTYMKITGGSLKVKTLLSNGSGSTAERGTGEESEYWEEKADQIRIYSGSRYEMVNEAKAGSVCAVTGLSKTYPGEGLGIEAASEIPVLEPVLTYQIQLPPECDVHRMLLQLRQMEEEDPLLHIVWNEQLNEIHAQLMGEVQIEILKRLILERFGVAVEFGTGNILYKETIQEAIEGVGHFEPLRHYAEVHLLMEPLEAGSGLQFSSACSEDILDRNWQRLILTHLEEKEHLGVLTGSPITDMKLTVVTGRAHQKHTEGGDFRQATYRAVRQGLKKAKSILLEPYYEYRLEVPAEMIGRALADMQKMHGTFGSPLMEGEMSVLSGTAPVVTMRDYQTEVIAYTKGRGRLFCTFKGYAPCHNADEVIEAIGYDSEHDLDNPTGSVFCSHGAGFVVKWDQVQEYMHVESGLSLPEVEVKRGISEALSSSSVPGESGAWQSEKELEEIFVRTFGPIKRERSDSSFRSTSVNKDETKVKIRQKPDMQEEYLLVDGYNIIFSWDELKDLAEVNIESARNKLMDILCNYQGYKKCTLILVFDAYKVEGNIGEVLLYNNIHVVYTKEAETADQYIEKVVHEIGRKYHVTVATSDRLEQVIIMGQGGNLLSARGLKEEIEIVNNEIRNECLAKRQNSRNYLFNHMSDEMADYMEDVRLGKKEIK
ncbi:translation factor GTPase family protein [Robinsoniella peoriensis]|uniref:translation factor GTPase family protein n=1 Tax=Robinsoniella peoriensis TaxID=180332 RepID=UPI00085C85B8|nr:TetM/TetW/TetO/TetS family tetracycline resistance ribosomal protection protein [Robinsoniella peoriensis]